MTNENTNPGTITIDPGVIERRNAHLFEIVGRLREEQPDATGEQVVETSLRMASFDVATDAERLLGFIESISWFIAQTVAAMDESDVEHDDDVERAIWHIAVLIDHAKADCRELRDAAYSVSNVMSGATIRL